MILYSNCYILNFMENETKERRVTAGFYKQYDGKDIYVVGVFTNISTDTKIVLCRKEYGKGGYFAIDYSDFCSEIDLYGNKVKRFTLNTKRDKLDVYDVNELIRQGYPPPVRHTKEYYLADPFDTFRVTCNTYYDYAKELCDGYKDDLRMYNIIKSGKTEMSLYNDEDTLKLIEDVEFTQNVFDTWLSEYKSFFEAHCVNKQSIRSYAKEHGKNRGSIEHWKRKMLAAFANILEKRDKTDGKIRIVPQYYKPTENK